VLYLSALETLRLEALYKTTTFAFTFIENWALKIQGWWVRLPAANFQHFVALGGFW